MAEYPIIKEGEYYISIETEHFYFDVYKAWNGTGGGAMFRAGSYVKKKSDRKYYLDYELFAEWDYKDKQTAFEEAKKHIFENMKRLCTELQPTADVAEVKHGYWKLTKTEFGWNGSEYPAEYTCSLCGRTAKQEEPYCHCGARMDGN